MVVQHVLAPATAKSVSCSHTQHRRRGTRSHSLTSNRRQRARNPCCATWAEGARIIGYMQTNTSSHRSRQSIVLCARNAKRAHLLVHSQLTCTNELASPAHHLVQRDPHPPPRHTRGNIPRRYIPHSNAINPLMHISNIVCCR